MIEIIMENIALSFAYLLSDEDGHFEMITVLMASYLIPRFIYFAFSKLLMKPSLNLVTVGATKRAR